MLTVTTTMIGSKADVPTSLLEEVTRLEKLFNVDPTKLKEITDHFISELAKGSFGLPKAPLNPDALLTCRQA